MIVHKGMTIWFTAPYESEKTTIARLLEQKLESAGAVVQSFDDNELHNFF